MSIHIPDLRFEQSFMKNLYAYAGHKFPSPQELHRNQVTDSEIERLHDGIDEEEMKIRNTDHLPEDTLPPLPVTVILYAIIKDQILMPLMQGFLWTGLLISIRPFLKALTLQGKRSGIWVSNALGLNRIRHRRTYV